ncbi:MAG: hypothetical protein Kow0068_03510 [Marinilabiliales bacterium]
MKIVALLSYILLVLCSYSQQEETLKIEYLRKVQFVKIDEPGNMYLLWRDINPKNSEVDSMIYTSILMDSTSHNMELTFTNASVGDIDNCKYILLIHQDTIKKVSIEVNNKTMLEKLIMQAKKQYNSPYIDRSDKHSELYIWKSKECIFTPELIIEKNGKKGIFTIDGNNN